MDACSQENFGDTSQRLVVARYEREIAPFSYHIGRQLHYLEDMLENYQELQRKVPNTAPNRAITGRSIARTRCYSASLFGIWRYQAGRGRRLNMNLIF